MTRLLPLLMLAVFIFLSRDTTYAQTKSKQTIKLGEFDEIVIKHKNEKDAKITIEIKDGEVLVDGKKIEQFSNADVSVFRRKITPRDGNAVNFNNSGSFGNFEPGVDEGDDIIPNKAVLGVITEKKAADGVTIKTVGKGTPAEKAGLKVGDVITAIDDEKVNEPDDLFEKIGEYDPQDKVTVSYIRNGKSNKASVTLGERKTVRSEDLGGMFPQNPRIFTLPPGGFRGNDRFGNDWFGMNDNGAKLGLQVQDTQNGEGAEILNITSDSPAEKAGFQKEDIVTELAGKTIKSAADLSKAYRESQDKTSITAKVKRDGKLTPISIEIPKHLHKADL